MAPQGQGHPTLKQAKSLLQDHAPLAAVPKVSMAATTRPDVTTSSHLAFTLTSFYQPLLFFKHLRSPSLAPCQPAREILSSWVDILPTGR